MTANNGETMLTGAQVMAIVPTTDLTRAKAFYGETLGLVDANVATPGPQVIYLCGNTLLEVYERPTAGEARQGSARGCRPPISWPRKSRSTSRIFTPEPDASHAGNCGSGRNFGSAASFTAFGVQMPESW